MAPIRALPGALAQPTLRPASVIGHEGRPWTSPTVAPFRRTRFKVFGEMKAGKLPARWWPAAPQVKTAKWFSADLRPAVTNVGHVELSEEIVKGRGRSIQARLVLITVEVRAKDTSAKKPSFFGSEKIKAEWL